MSVGEVDPSLLGLWSHSMLAELGDFCRLFSPWCTSLGWASQSLVRLNASPVPHPFRCNLFVLFLISGSACLCLPTWQWANLINLIESNVLLWESRKRGPATPSGSSILLSPSPQNLHVHDILLGGNGLTPISKMENKSQFILSQLWPTNGPCLYVYDKQGSSNVILIFFLKCLISDVTMEPLMKAIYLLSLLYFTGEGGNRK